MIERGRMIYMDDNGMERYRGIPFPSSVQSRILACLDGDKIFTFTNLFLILFFKKQ